MLKIGQKTITTLQEGSVYIEEWNAPVGDPWPTGPGVSAHQEFLDSSGQIIIDINGEVTARTVKFSEPPEAMQQVPNGAGFRTFVVDADGPHCIRYGTVFRRQLTFADPPSNAPGGAFVPKRFTDDFNRPNGAIGGQWVPMPWGAGINQGGTNNLKGVGPIIPGVPFYGVRYYAPFASDAIEVSLSVTDKGGQPTSWCAVVTACNSDGSKFQYVQFKPNDTVNMGVGNAPNLAGLDPQVDDQVITIPTGSLLNLKLRYDPATKTYGLYSSNYGEEFISWTDEDDVAPHGRGFRYFGIIGDTAAATGGVQIGYISGADVV